jgi:8-oxo-dGTP pyrophosphatase MutT (NUDIX family)
MELDSALRQQFENRLRAFERRAAPDDHGLRHAAVALVLLPGDDGEAAFLLTRRATRLRAHPGQWALPGGRLDHGEDAIGAARRELSEEVGLAVEEHAVLGLLDDYCTRSGFAMTPVVVWAGDASELTLDPNEVAAVHRIPLTELERSDSPRFISIPESDRAVVQVAIFEHLIHAPTAAVLYQFREVCLAGRATRVADLEQPVWAWGSSRE